jgi:hypothetical protein
MHLWEQAKREGRNVYYLDNSYFDSCREQYFRVARNRLQHSGRGISDGRRLKSLGIVLHPYRSGGDYALVCAQSDEFMATVAGVPNWLGAVIAKLENSSEQYVVRRKGEQRPFLEDLSRARRVITWSSAAAVMALIHGVKVECSENCAAYGVMDRQKWVEVLADQQWTLDEMKRGDAWRVLEQKAGSSSPVFKTATGR